MWSQFAPNLSRLQNNLTENNVSQFPPNLSQFQYKIECIEFECNKFVLVLVQIDLMHFEHSKCISST
jgi:hypothetical protein